VGKMLTPKVLTSIPLRLDLFFHTWILWLIFCHCFLCNHHWWKFIVQVYWGAPQAFLLAVNLHKNPVANVCKFCQIWSHPKRKFTRFRQVSTVRQGFSASFSPVLTVFQKLVAINAISFWGWSRLALHH